MTVFDHGVRVSPSAAVLKREDRLARVCRGQGRGREARGGHGASARRPAVRADRFLEAAQDLPRLPAGGLHRLTIILPAGAPEVGKPGIL
nr:hypothetical protein [uncultured Rhodopila sp.]